MMLDRAVCFFFFREPYGYNMFFFFEPTHEYDVKKTGEPMLYFLPGIPEFVVHAVNAWPRKTGDERKRGKEYQNMQTEA